MTIRPEFLAMLDLETELGLEATTFTGDILELAGRRSAYIINAANDAVWLFTHGLDDTDDDELRAHQRGELVKMFARLFREILRPPPRDMEHVSCYVPPV